jgi:hypothetical protein
MQNLTKLFDLKDYKLLIFSLFISLITYGFALTNYTITIDNETPIYSDFGMEFGRWGQNLILYHLFNGHLHYFTLVTSLFIYSIAAVGLTKVFKLQDTTSYIFCALFITFPQISYQVVFAMMADIAAIGVLLSVFCINFFIKGNEAKNKKIKTVNYLWMVLILTFSLSIYQAFILIPPTIYALVFFINTFKENISLKKELTNFLILGLLIIISVVLYIISVKLICPPISSNGYLSSFISGGSDNHFSEFCLILYHNLI